MTPIANRPLISFQLEFLESAGFEECFVVTSTGRNHDAIEGYLAESYRGKLKATLLAFDPSLGSAELLLKLRDRLVSDFIVLSGDLVVSEPRQFLHRLADTHRTKSAAITALAYRARTDSLPDVDAALSASAASAAHSAALPSAAAAAAATASSSSASARKRGGKANGAARSNCGGAAAAADAPAKDSAKAPKPSMYLGIAAPNNRLAMYVNADDVDDDDVIVLRKALLRRVPRLAIRSDLVDAHLYIVSHWTLSLLPEIVSKGMVSLQADLLPIMVRGQFVRAWRERAAAILRNDPRTLYDTSADVDADAIKCFMHVLDDAHYCRRVQTLNDFILVNRDVAAHKGQTGFRPAVAPSKGHNFVDPGTTIDAQANVGPDCVVGAGTFIGAGSSVVFSNVGAHCKIGANVKIVNSVLLDHVTIEDNTTVHNSIVCSSSYVRVGCTVKDCTIGVSFDLRAGSELQSLRVGGGGSSSSAGSSIQQR
jgi:translation initiation factor eIF-2B subunit gamma